MKIRNAIQISWMNYWIRGYQVTLLAWICRQQKQQFYLMIFCWRWELFWKNKIKACAYNFLGNLATEAVDNQRVKTLATNEVLQSEMKTRRIRNDLPLKPKYARAHKHIVHATDEKSINLLVKRCLNLLISFALFNVVVVYMLFAFPIYLLKISMFKMFQYVTRDSNDSSENGFEFLSPMELFWLYDSKQNKSIGSCMFIIEGK